MNIQRIEAAYERIKSHIRKTPLLNAPLLDEAVGRRVFVKAECLQHTGSFKYRGARAAVSALAPEIRTRGVLAFSSGNHAQGVALAAREHGCPAVIVMPADAPAIKINNTRALGAEVVLYDRAGGEKREEVGARIEAARGLHLIRPFDDPEVIAGQGSVGLEIARQAEEAGVDGSAQVLVCCGGGGLTSGIALALEAHAPQLRVCPVEPEGFDDVARSLHAGERLSNAGPERGLCDAVLTPAPGELTFPIMARLCGAGRVVGESEVLQAMAMAARHLKIVAEPGGAVALAAALFHPLPEGQSDVIAVVSGGNADPVVLAQALTHGH